MINTVIWARHKNKNITGNQCRSLHGAHHFHFVHIVLINSIELFHVVGSHSCPQSFPQNLPIEFQGVHPLHRNPFHWNPLHRNPLHRNPSHRNHFTETHFTETHFTETHFTETRAVDGPEFFGLARPVLMFGPARTGPLIVIN